MTTDDEAEAERVIAELRDLGKKLTRGLSAEAERQHVASRAADLIAAMLREIEDRDGREQHPDTWA